MLIHWIGASQYRVLPKVVSMEGKPVEALLDVLFGYSETIEYDFRFHPSLLYTFALDLDQFA